MTWNWVSIPSNEEVKVFKFAETYRNLNKITNPNLKKVYVRDMFENLHRLMQPTFEQKNIELEIILKDPELTLEADTDLIEQVLINLILNAAEAVKEAASPRIQLSAISPPATKWLLKWLITASAFRPTSWKRYSSLSFFSTRKTGSGIGLSLCKQIMMLHKGNIKVQSVAGEGTAFLLFF